MRALQKLVTRGNSVGINMPRTMLINLGWLPGENLIIELLEDDSVRLRRPCAQDFAPMRPPRLVHDAVGAVAK